MFEEGADPREKTISNSINSNLSCITSIHNLYYTDLILLYFLQETKSDNFLKGEFYEH